MDYVIHVLKRLVPQFVLLIMSTIFILNVDPLQYPIAGMLELLCYAILVAVMVLSYFFNKSRSFFLMIVLLFTLFLYKSVSTFNPELFSGEIYPILCTLLPVNILIFSLIKERGIFSSWGMLRFGFLIFQLYLAWVAIAVNNSVPSWITKMYIPVSTKNLTPLPQLAIIAFLITLALLIAKLVMYRFTLDNAFTGVLIFTFLSLHWNHELVVPVFYIAAGVSLLTAILRDSYTMAFNDELTELPSRRALKQDMMKLGAKYTIAMLDIDFFKKFNDRYGHDTGDEVLRLVASIIKNVDGGGKAFRYGGEEFTLLFPGKNIAEVMPCLEELRKAVEQRRFIVRGKDRPKEKPKESKAVKSVGKQISVTVSIGAAERNEKNKTADVVIKEADKALYRAKNKGRNCVSR